jgi:replication-associated recombination protein RarA
MKHLSSTSENWTVKYRPKSISEMIIPESCKRYFERYQGGQRQPLILFGKPGSGKSLMASLLSNEDNIHIQCGLESDIKKIQEMLKSAT